MKIISNYMGTGSTMTNPHYVPHKPTMLSDVPVGQDIGFLPHYMHAKSCSCLLSDLGRHFGVSRYLCCFLPEIGCLSSLARISENTKR